MMHPEYFRCALLYLLLIFFENGEEIKALSRNIFHGMKKRRKKDFWKKDFWPKYTVGFPPMGRVFILSTEYPLGEFREFLHPLKFAEYIFQTTSETSFSLGFLSLNNNTLLSAPFFTHI